MSVPVLFVCLFVCCFTSQVNSYGHCGTVSSPNHTFSWAGLNKRLLNLLNTLRKSEKMQGLPSMLSRFRNEFNLFNNTGVRMLDYIYQMKKSHFGWRKNVNILSFLHNIKMDVIT